MLRTWAEPAKLGLLYATAAVAGYLFSLVGAPLPWMIGPLVVTALLMLTGVSQVTVPVRTRPWGQGVVAAQVGLYFSPEAFRLLLEVAPLMIGMALITAGLAFAMAMLLARIGRFGMTQALIASLPTSPVEAAELGERYGIEPTLVVMSQTIRIAGVVVIVPILIYAAGDAPDRSLSRITGDFVPLDFALLTLLAMIGGLTFRRLRIANPNFLGPLAFSAAVTAAGFELTPFPPAILAMAQIILGTWLGGAFRPTLVASAGRLVAASACTALLFLALCCGTGVGVASLLGWNWQTLVLSTAPGGVTEMALTAKYLGTDVALITAFHLTRIFIIVPNIAWVVDVMHRSESRRGFE